MRFISFIIVLSISYRCSSYSSVEHVRKAFVMDKKAVKILQSALDDYGPDAIDYVLEHYQMVSQGENDRKIVENPLLAFQIMRRVVVDLRGVISSVYQRNWELGNELEKSLELLYSFTYSEHLVEAIEGLLRLQESFLLHPQQLAKGTIKHIDTAARLKVSDCLLIAESAKYSLRLDMQVQWLQQAHDMCVSQVTSCRDSCKHTTQQMYSAAKVQHDEAKAWVDEHNEYPMTDDGEPWLVLPDYTLRVPALVQRTLQIESETFSYVDNETVICYNGSLMTEGEKSKLYCYYLTLPDNVYVTLQHYKVEVRALEPRVITIYDVINDREAELLKELATPALVRSEVLTESASLRSEVDKTRISETAWLEDDDHPTVAAISRRIQAITGLTVNNDTAENFQVVNYGIGGLYRAHFDFIQSKELMKPEANYDDLSNDLDDRLVTFLLYLSDVELGGATVFPNAKVAVTPKKYSATMWYNLNTSGYPDVRTLHGGCPVLYGSKWIANKWIHNTEQLFKYRCPAKTSLEL